MKNPSACPYNQRFWVEAPHPFITRARLRAILDPKPGERVLEVGPGTGYYTLDVAEWVGREGGVDILDIQRDMLDHTMRRAAERGIENITPAEADATAMPYEDGTFDAAFPGHRAGRGPRSGFGRPRAGEFFGPAAGSWSASCWAIPTTSPSARSGSGLPGQG